MDPPVTAKELIRRTELMLSPMVTIPEPAFMVSD